MSQDLIASGRLRVGVNLQDSVDVAERTVTESAVRGEKHFELYVASSVGPGLALAKGRGSASLPGNVLQDDELGAYYFKARSTTLQNTAALRAAVDAAVVAGQRPASRLILETNLNNAAPRLAVYVSSEGYLGVGTAFNPAVAATRAAHAVHVVGSGPAALPYVTVENYETAQHARFRIGRARGTFAAPSTIVTGDDLGALEFFAYTNQWHECSEIAAVAEGTVVAGTRPNSRLLLNTSFGGNILTRVQVLSGGTVLVGPVAASAGDPNRLVHIIRGATGFSPLKVEVTGGGAGANCVRLDGGDNTVTGSTYIAFHRPDGSQIGGVTQNGAASVAYNTTSDERLKENIRDMDNGIALIQAMKPRLYNFKGDALRSIRGFIAQELHAVYPEAVTVGAGDVCACGVGEVDVDGSICTKHQEDCCHVNPWAVDYSRLMPAVVKAIQELAAKLPA